MVLLSLRVRTAPTRALACLALAIPFVAGGCSGSGGSGSGSTTSSSAVTGFDVVAFNVQQGETWELNRPIDVTFNAAVDFATVNSNTIQIRSIGDANASLPPNTGSGTQGEPAVGTFELVSPQVVRFTPRCPTTTNPPDAGFLPRQFYTVRLPASGGPVVHSTTNRPLSNKVTRSFATPQSAATSSLFVDFVPGAPSTVVRPQGSQETEATYLELGLDASNRVYFEEDPQTQAISLPLGFLAPINHYSRIGNRVAWMIQVDQPVNPSPENLGPNRVGLEWLDALGNWNRFPADVSIESNCTANGAMLRVTPLGILPQGAEVRAFLGVGFEDIAGDARTVAEAIVIAPIQTSFNPGTQTQGDDADQVFEPFLLSGDDEGSLEDTTAVSLATRAEWGGDRLAASFDFNGTGGPGGDFDWHIPLNTTLLIDTVSDTIVGGPNGVPTTQQSVINGIIDVRDVFVPASSQLIAVGPNPLQIFATGNVLIEGTISVDGGNSAGVGTLNTTNLPEPGATGRAGGGAGGTGSFLTTESTPFGGPGFGAFNEVGLGGQGGETSFHPFDKNARRGAGGGGGRFGPDVRYDFQNTLVRCQTLLGMDAEPGFGGGDGGQGAVSQPGRAQGGEIGPGPFVDGDDGNDFLGTLIVDPSGPAPAAVEGELTGVWAGAGGGGGGDAVRSNSFPLVPFSPTGDEKGAGGGGAAGGLRIAAIGPIVVADGGRVTADGGHGGGGENTSFFDRVGGGSGGASGGHIVLESTAFIEVAGAAMDGNQIPFWYTDNPNASVHEARPISALGGQGGAGNQNKGGANENGETLWRCDAIPMSYFETLPVPPSQNTCYTTQPNFNDPLGPTLGAGGDGSPGLIQLHVPDPEQNLRFAALQTGGLPAYGQGLDVTPAFAPPPVGWESPTAPADLLVARFQSLSVGQSTWISLGQARHNPGGPDDQVELFFGGLDPQGLVRTAPNGAVLTEPPLLGPAVVQSAPATPYVATDLHTMVFDASGVSGFDDVYERNPELMRGFTLRLVQVLAPNAQRDFRAVTGSYDPSLDQLSVTVDSSNGALTDFNPGGDVEASLIPRSFLVESGGAFDTLDEDHSIQITFDATLAGPTGLPDESQSFSSLNAGSWAAQIGQLNQMNWDFVRFRVLFDLDSNGAGIDVTAARPSVLHLRVPDRF